MYARFWSDEMFVRDQHEFEQWVAACECEALQLRDNLFILRSYAWHEHAGIPEFRMVEHDDGDQWVWDYEEFDFFEELREHLIEGQAVNFYELNSPEDGEDWYDEMDLALPGDFMTITTLISGFENYPLRDVLVSTTTLHHPCKVEDTWRALTEGAPATIAVDLDDDTDEPEAAPTWVSAFDDGPGAQWVSAFDDTPADDPLGFAYDSDDEPLAIEHYDEEAPLALTFYDDDEEDDDDEQPLLLEHHA